MYREMENVSILSTMMQSSRPSGIGRSLTMPRTACVCSQNWMHGSACPGLPPMEATRVGINRGACISALLEMILPSPLLCFCADLTRSGCAVIDRPCAHRTRIPSLRTAVYPEEQATALYWNRLRFLLNPEDRMQISCIPDSFHIEFITILVP